MNPDQIKELLTRVKSGDTDVEEALNQLKNLPFSSLEHSRIDHHRPLRTGFPEVIFCEGKNPDDVTDIADELLENQPNLLATRADEEMYEAITTVAEDAEYHRDANCVTVLREQPDPLEGQVGIVSAGTSDNNVAEEARITCETFGAPVRTAYDAGVAGLHRLLPERDLMKNSNILIVAAGMEGALPSVVGGLTGKPIVGVPTSAGYGSSFGGLAALLGMLNSCTPSVVTVNINNGFGAGFFACSMLRSMDNSS